MLIGRTGRGQEQDVAARSAARQAATLWENFGWALAYARAVGGDIRRRIQPGGCVGLDHRGGRLAGRCLGRWLGQRGLLPRTLATTSGLLSASFLALDGGPVALPGMPVTPVRRSFLASRAAVTSLGPRRQEPAFTTFEQTATAARVPAAKAAWLTRCQRAGKLNRAHGRTRSRAVRRREGDTSRRYFAPTTWTPLVQAPAADTCQITCDTSNVRGDAGAWSKGRPMPRSTDRGMAQLALRLWLSSWPLLTVCRGISARRVDSDCRPRPISSNSSRYGP